jgi:DNA polymerase III alpha subunit
MTDRYVELHARSAFSFLEGASLPEAMTQQVRPADAAPGMAAA